MKMKWKWSCSFVSNSLQPNGLQPTRLLRPWDSPGKNPGVGCHFLLQCMKVRNEREVAQWCPTLSNPTDCSPPGSSVRGIFQAKVLEWVPLPSPTLSWRIQWIKKPGRLQCMGSHRVRHDWSDLGCMQACLYLYLHAIRHSMCNQLNTKVRFWQLRRKSEV